MELYENQFHKLIAKKYVVSDGMVTRILREATKHYQPHKNYLPTVLCMDEFKAMKSIAGSMSFICVGQINNQSTIHDSGRSQTLQIDPVLPLTTRTDL